MNIMKASDINNNLKRFHVKKDQADSGNKFISSESIAKLIFDFLVHEKNLDHEKVTLYNGTGALISKTADAATKPLDVVFKSDADQFIIESDVSDDRLEDIISLKDSFSDIFFSLYHNEKLRQFIFDGLDALPNSICVYDKELHLLYANSDFCNYLHIKDRESQLGRYTHDILKDCGTSFESLKKPHTGLKVHDIVKYGKPVIDWEVEVTNTKDPGAYMIASNDMYPMFDKAGKVNGVAEISRSRNIKIKQARDTLGLQADYTFDDIIGNSKQMTEAKKLAMSFAVSPYNVLIYGESGVGKELFAQSIHNYSIRRNKPFVAINCAGISPELIDSELFGYESGAFTGAAKNGHVGKFELSNEGTLFLDEVAELPLHAQTKLLRTLETHQITRVGGTKNISVDVRVIAATNRSLEKMIKEGLFREDLYYRLMVLNLTIPPLRNRPEDIMPCCDFFIRQAMRINNSEAKTIDEDAKKMLLQYDWPGNVRELRNVINRVYVMSLSSVITTEILTSAFQSNMPNHIGTSKALTPEEMLQEKRLQIDQSYVSLLKEALILSEGNKTEAAKLLGVSRKTVYNMLDKYKNYFE